MIEKYIKESKTSTTFMKSSILIANKLLLENERVVWAISANVQITKIKDLKANVFNLKDKMAGVVVITDKRLIFCGKTLWLENTKILDIKDITSIDIKSNLISSVLRISGITEMIVIDGSNKVLNEFKTRLDSVIYQNKEKQTTNISSADEILKYKKLFDDGIITKEEFDKKKKQILGV